jgi:hypothetical protein
VISATGGDFDSAAAGAVTLCAATAAVTFPVIQAAAASAATVSNRRCNIDFILAPAKLLVIPDE